MTDCMFKGLHARTHVCVLRVCVQPRFPQQTQLSGPLDYAYVTAALFQDLVLSKRSDKEA